MPSDALYLGVPGATLATAFREGSLPRFAWRLMGSSVAKGKEVLSGLKREQHKTLLLVFTSLPLDTIRLSPTVVDILPH